MFLIWYQILFYLSFSGSWCSVAALETCLLWAWEMNSSCVLPCVCSKRKMAPSFPSTPVEIKRVAFIHTISSMDARVRVSKNLTNSSRHAFHIAKHFLATGLRICVENDVGSTFPKNNIATCIIVSKVAPPPGWTKILSKCLEIICWWKLIAESVSITESYLQ